MKVFIKRVLASMVLIATLVIVPSSAQADVPNPGVGVVIIAHRAGGLDAPENTQAAMDLAKKKVNWSEIDVQWTKSNYPIIMHDDTVDRTTDKSGKVKDFYLPDFYKMDAASYAPWNSKDSKGNWVYPQYHGTYTDDAGNVKAVVHPPYGWEIFNTANNAKMNLLLDVKVVPTQTQAASLYDYINRFSYQDNVVYQSSADGIAAMRKYYPDLKYNLIEWPAAGTIRTVDSLKAMGASGYSIPYSSISQSTVAYYHTNGIRVFSWTTDKPEYDTEANWKKVVDAGTDGLITNNYGPASALY